MRMMTKTRMMRMMTKTRMMNDGLEYGIRVTMLRLMNFRGLSYTEALEDMINDTVRHGMGLNGHGLAFGHWNGAILA
jgi:hypothetical protein